MPYRLLKPKACAACRRPRRRLTATGALPISFETTTWSLGTPLLTTLNASVHGLFGVRAPYRQPLHRDAALGQGVEIHSCKLRRAVETDARGQFDSEACGRLYQHVTCSKRAAERIDMTTPVKTVVRRAPSLLWRQARRKAGSPPLR